MPLLLPLRLAEVTEYSDALEPEPHVFERDNPKEIAASLKRSADKSKNRTSEPLGGVYAEPSTSFAPAGTFR
jgi:hypothetical protein